eukprot:gene58034-biopygen55763
MYLVPGAGGTPGADNGARYVIVFALDALSRAGDRAGLCAALAALPPHARCAADPAALPFRRCHLTTREHTF